MTKLTQEQIDEIAGLHDKWMRGEEGGKRAILDDANLSFAKLTDINLMGATIQNAKLTGAHMEGARLCGADLLGADLSFTKLASADFTDATLLFASLRGADLHGVFGDMQFIRSMQIEEWPVVWTADRLQIGCENHSIDEWRAFSDDEIDEMAEGALEWWRKWKEFILRAIELSPAEPTRPADEEGANDAA